jgi:hypothetical protein
MADVILEITIPDAYVTKAIDAFTTIAGKHMMIEARGHAPDPANEFNGMWDFRIDEKDAAETLKQFGERCFRELGKAVINMVDKAEDVDRYRSEVSAVTPPASDVPSDILT